MPKNKNLELAWGGGVFAVLLDLRTGALWPYNCAQSAHIVHLHFGGKNFYQSRSGSSGAGWVPAKPFLRLVHTYRVDTGNPMNVPNLLEVGDTVPGRKVIVPINYGEGEPIPADWPVFVAVGVHRDYGRFTDLEYYQVAWDRLYMISKYSLLETLIGEGVYVDVDQRIRVYPAVGLDLVERIYPITLHAREGVKNMRKALVALFSRELSFRYAEGDLEAKYRTPEFYQRLGLWEIGGYFYKIAQGVAWARYAPEELATRSQLQAAAPGNVMVLTEHVYLQETEDGFYAAGRFTLESGGEETVGEELPVTEALRAMGGRADELEVRLRDEVERRARRAQAADMLSVREGEEPLDAILRIFAHEPVTLADSVAAGNCESGTRTFRDSNFPGRESITVRELAPFVSQEEVRKVLLWKFEGALVDYERDDELAVSERIISEDE